MLGFGTGVALDAGAHATLAKLNARASITRNHGFSVSEPTLGSAKFNPTTRSLVNRRPAITTPDIDTPDSTIPSKWCVIISISFFMSLDQFSRSRPTCGFAALMF